MVHLPPFACITDKPFRCCCPGFYPEPLLCCIRSKSHFLPPKPYTDRATSKLTKSTDSFTLENATKIVRPKCSTVISEQLTARTPHPIAQCVPRTPLWNASSLRHNRQNTVPETAQHRFRCGFAGFSDIVVFREPFCGVRAKEKPPEVEAFSTNIKSFAPFDNA